MKGISEGGHGSSKCSKVRNSRGQGTLSSSLLAGPSHVSFDDIASGVNYHPSAQDALRPLQPSNHCVLRESKLILIFANCCRQVNSALGFREERPLPAALGNNVLSQKLR